MGAWSFHKGGNGGFTQVLSRAATALGRGDPPRVPGRERDHAATGRATGRRARGRVRAPRPGRRVRAGPAPDVHGARRPARAAVGPRRRHPALPVPGDVGEGQLRARRAAGVPGAGRARGPLPRASPTWGRRSTTWSGPTTRRSTAGTAAAPTSTARSRARSTPTWRRPGKHVMSCFVQWVPYRLRESDWEAERQEPGRHGPADARVVLPGLRRPRAAARGGHAGATSSGWRASPRATSSTASCSPPRCSSSGRRRAMRDYRTPIEGYYQCGSGTHPGGCVTGAPGRLAARRILGDRERRAAGCEGCDEGLGGPVDGSGPRLPGAGHGSLVRPWLAPRARGQRARATLRSARIDR